MVQLFQVNLRQYRAKTFRYTPDLLLHSSEDAVEFVNQLGFVFFWPIKNVLLPSLWVATAGDRPVPDWHDDPGHVTWDWKDSLLGKHRLFYGRVLHRRNTFISLELLPFFYALSPNYGEPDTDYLDEYELGQITPEMKSIYEALLRLGPLDTLALREAAHLARAGNDSRFNRALDDLQITFKILPIGISNAGSWHYAMIYDILPHHYPELIQAARKIDDSSARLEILRRYFLSVGAAQLRDIQKLFSWKPKDIRSILEVLLKNQFIEDNVELEGSDGTWVALISLLNHA